MIYIYDMGKHRHLKRLSPMSLGGIGVVSGTVPVLMLSKEQADKQGKRIHSGNQPRDALGQSIGMPADPNGELR